MSTQLPAKKGLNPLFLVLAVLSAFPTAFVAVVFIAGSQSALAGLATAWCGMWTWVWWAMAKRY